MYANCIKTTNLAAQGNMGGGAGLQTSLFLLVLRQATPRGQTAGGQRHQEHCNPHPKPETWAPRRPPSHTPPSVLPPLSAASLWISETLQPRQSTTRIPHLRLTHLQFPLTPPGSSVSMRMSMRRDYRGGRAPL